jgi:hypothetical protein
MALGFPVTQTDMNSRVGQLAVAVRDVLTIDVPKVKATVDGMNDAALTALGYTAAEITLLRAVVVDLDNLRKVATGAQAQPAASNFLFNSAKVTGLV